MKKLGLIAGKGELPMAVADEAKCRAIPLLPWA